MNSQLSTFMALSGLAAASSHLTDARPAWIWAEDGKTLLWANPAGAAFFGVGTLAALSELSGLGRAPARPHIARVAASGSTERDTIDRLRFYRGLRVMLLTCTCRRLDLPNGSSGALIVALDAPANPGDGEEIALVDFLAGKDRVAVLYQRDGSLRTSGSDLDLPDGDSVRAALRQAKHAPLRRAFAFGEQLHEAAVLTLDSGSVLMVAEASGRPLAEDAAPVVAPEIAPVIDPATAPDPGEAAVPAGIAAPVSDPVSPDADTATPAPAAIPPRSRLSMGGLYAFASGTRFLSAGRTTEAAEPAALISRTDAAAPQDTAPSTEDLLAHDDIADDLHEADRPAVTAPEILETPEILAAEDEAPAGETGDEEIREEEIGALETTETLVAAAEAVAITDAAPEETLTEAAPEAAGTEATGTDADALPSPAVETAAEDAASAEAEAEVATEADTVGEDAGETADEARSDETPVAGASGFAFEARERPVRFAWKMDVERRFTFISPEFAEALGPQAADVVGLSWEEVAERFDLDRDGRVAAALRRRDTWSGRTVDWPVSGAALRVPVDMAALPAFDRQRVFEGFRGFGVCRTGEASEDAAATGLALVLREDAAAEPEDIAAAQGPADDAAPPASETAPETDAEIATEAADAGETLGTGAGAGTGADDTPALAAMLGSDPEDQAAEPAPRELTADVADLLDLPGAREIDDIFAADAADAEEEEAEEEDAASLAESDTASDTGSDSIEASAEEVPAAKADAPPEVLAEAGPSTPGDDDTGADDLDGGLDEGLDAGDLDGGDLDEHVDADDEAGTEAVAEEPAAHEAKSDDAPAAPSQAGLLPLIEPQAPVHTPDTRTPAQEAPAPRRDEELDTSRLSKPEREAFRKIAEALGARSELDEETAAAPTRTIAPAADTPATDAATGTQPAGSEPAEPVSPQTADTVGGREASNVASLGIIPRVQAPAPRAARTSLLDKLPVGVAIIAGEDVDYANATLLDLLGYADLDTLKSVGGLDAVFAEPEDWPSALPGAMTERTMRIRLSDGGTKPVKARLHTVPWKEGTALMMSLLDRHDPAQEAALDRLHEAQSALGLAEEHLAEMDAVLETATDGVLILDEGGRIVKVNRSAEALFDGAREEMVGAPLTDFLAPESHRDANDYLDGLARNGVASVLNDGREVIGQLRSGGLIPLFMTIGRVGHGSEGPRFCTVLRDITQWKTAEEELTDAKRQAENASSQKSDFLAKISHEIRTPLNAIIGFSEVMMEERFGPVGNDRYKGYLRDIHNSGSHIMSLINDLLDLSKIEAGKLDLTFEAVSANDIIRECVALMQPQANRERVIIRASLPTSVPKIVADGRSVRQIVLNLLSNAIKFNQPGGQVIVSTALEDTGEVILRVRDTGMGMSHQDLAAAMEPFRQLHTARHGGGTGLGLPLTKALVEANRASFRIDSEVNHGTLVEVTFPPQRVLAE